MDGTTTSQRKNSRSLITMTRGIRVNSDKADKTLDSDKIRKRMTASQTLQEQKQRGAVSFHLKPGQA